MADHACNIARSAIDLAQEPELKDHIRIGEMGENRFVDVGRCARRLHQV
jgi:hypothetical protein